MERVGHALPFDSAGLGEARCSLRARELLPTLPGLAQTLLPPFIHKGANSPVLHLHRVTVEHY